MCTQWSKDTKNMNNEIVLRKSVALFPSPSALSNLLIMRTKCRTPGKSIGRVGSSTQLLPSLNKCQKRSSKQVFPLLTKTKIPHLVSKPEERHEAQIQNNSGLKPAGWVHPSNSRSWLLINHLSALQHFLPPTWDETWPNIPTCPGSEQDGWFFAAARRGHSWDKEVILYCTSWPGQRDSFGDKGFLPVEKRSWREPSTLSNIRWFSLWIIYFLISFAIVPFLTSLLFTVFFSYFDP